MSNEVIAAVACMVETLAVTGISAWSAARSSTRSETVCSVVLLAVNLLAVVLAAPFIWMTLYHRSGNPYLLNALAGVWISTSTVIIFTPVYANGFRRLFRWGKPEAVRYSVEAGSVHSLAMRFAVVVIYGLAIVLAAPYIGRNVLQ